MTEVTPVTVPLSRRLVYSLITTLIVLGLVEFAARWNGYGQRMYTVTDERVGFRLMPSQDRTTARGQHIHVNSHGMRDDEFPREKPPGEFRVLLLGDSLTFGIDVEQEEIFARLLHRSLAAKAKGKSIRVMNGAVQGYDATNERDWLQHFGFDLAPDLVVVMFFANDIEINERKLSMWEFPGRDWLRHTAIFEAIESWHLERESLRLGESGEAARLRESQRRELIKKYIGTVAWNPNEPKEKQGIRVVHGILDEMRKTCAARKIGFAVAMLPSFANTRDPALPNLMAGLSYEFDHPTQEWPTPIVNIYLIGAFQGRHDESWLEWDPGHLSPVGHQIVASALERWLIERKLVPIEP